MRTLLPSFALKKQVFSHLLAVINIYKLTTNKSCDNNSMRVYIANILLLLLLLTVSQVDVPSGTMVYKVTNL